MMHSVDYTRAQIVDLMQQLYRARELSRGYEEPEKSAYQVGVLTAIHIFEDYLGFREHSDCNICKLEDSE